MINIIYMYKLYIFKIYFVYPKSAVTQTSLMSFISIFFPPVIIAWGWGVLGSWYLHVHCKIERTHVVISKSSIIYLTKSWCAVFSTW